VRDPPRWVCWENHHGLARSLLPGAIEIQWIPISTTEEVMARNENRSSNVREDDRTISAWSDVANSRATVSTFMNLVESVQDNTSSDDEVVAVLAHILATRNVSLAGRPLRIGI
jgi:hypothetical protein